MKSEQGRAYDEWLDRVADGVKPTPENFARSALGDIPKVETRVRLPTNWRAWGFSSRAEMERAWSTEGDRQ